MTVQEMGRATLKRAIDHCGGDVQMAARVIGIGKTTAYRWLKEMDGGSVAEAVQSKASSCFSMLQSEAQVAREKYDLSPMWVEASDETVRMLQDAIREMRR